MIFLTQSNTYDEQPDIVLAMLKENGFAWITDGIFITDKNFTTLIIRKNDDIPLKLDFVNDLSVHFGGLNKTNLFYCTDSVRNILSNKITAVFRYAAKDAADIREIFLHIRSFYWNP